MMSGNAAVWLTPAGWEQLKTELDTLQATVAHQQQVDEVDHDKQQWQQQRIRELQDLLGSAEVGAPPPDDGIAESGMVLTVRFDEVGDTETFLLASRAGHEPDDTLEVYSPDSPLGRALLGATAGDTREYRLPSGATMTVTLLSAAPFRDLAGQV